MKLYNLLVLVLLSSLVEGVTFNLNSSLSSIIIKILNGMKIEGNLVNLIKCEYDVKTSDLIESVIEMILQDYKIRIYDLNTAISLNHDERSLNTIFFGSFSMKIFDGNYFKPNGKILCIISSFSEMKSLIQDLWTKQIMNVIFLLLSEGIEMEIYTFSPYSFGKCSEIVLKKIEINEINLEIRKNFYGCPFRMITRIEAPFVDNSTSKLTGFEISLLEGELRVEYFSKFSNIFIL